MGILSDFGKGVEGAVRNTAKGVGGLFESVGQEFRRFSKTDLGRAALTGAAIYFGGGALGWWDTFLTAPAGAAAGGVAPATEAGGGLAQELLAGGEAATAGTAQAAAPVAATESGGALGSGLQAAQAPVTNTVATGSGAELGGADLTAQEMYAPKVAEGKNWFTNLHPLAQYGLLQSGMGAVQNAFTPNAIDVERERAKLQREEDERRRKIWNQNTAVGNVNLGFKPKPLLGSRMG